mmetsp:Transcript_52832/g.115932  ORF Transcript_52832/g.115932 Transcript_52832/m.115932 type:complete len:241 (-) Transcript_52832:2307-3029(-)
MTTRTSTIARISAVTVSTMRPRSCGPRWSRHSRPPRTGHPRRPHHSRCGASHAGTRWPPHSHTSWTANRGARRGTHSRTRRHAAHLRTAHPRARRHTHTAAHARARRATEALTRWATHRWRAPHTRRSHRRGRPPHSWCAHSGPLSRAADAPSRSGPWSSGSSSTCGRPRSHRAGARSLACIPVARSCRLSSRSKSARILLCGWSRSIIRPHLCALERASRLLQPQLLHGLRSGIENAIS